MRWPLEDDGDSVQIATVCLIIREGTPLAGGPSLGNAMKAYFFDKPDIILNAEALQREGVLTMCLPEDVQQQEETLSAVCAQHGYIDRDEVSLHPETPNLADLSRTFFSEHSHDEDEVRFVRDGSGIFDIRDRDDTWMRIEVQPGDLIIVPKDRYHRFSLGAEGHIHCIRLFQNREGWTPHMRNDDAQAT